MQKIIDKRKKSENLGWRIRCFPYFFLIGFTKCGTTDLFAALSHVPDIIRPFAKEAEFWQKYRLTDQIQKGMPLEMTAAKFIEIITLRKYPTREEGNDSWK